MLDTIREQKNAKEISIRYVFLAALFWILTLSWIVCIFMLSADTASESSDLSNTVLMYINELFNMILKDDSILRVISHASEFALLTVFCYYINIFYAEHSFSKKLFLFKEADKNSLNINGLHNQINRLITMTNTTQENSTKKYKKKILILKK